MKRKGFFETPTMKKAIKFAAKESTKEQVKVLKKAGFKFPMKRKERTHNIEDTHYACNEQMERLGADTPCCICFGHKCKQLKAIKKECDACKPREHGIVIVEKVEEGGRCIQCRRIVCSPKPMKRIKKEVEKKKHIHRYKVYGSTAVCKCGQIKVKSSPKPTKIEKLIEEIEIRGITITMEDISYFPCIESGTWKRFKKEINNLLSH